MSEQLKVKYFHPALNSDGRVLSSANIIWAERDRGSAYYRVSRFAMNGGKFPPNHPCAPFDVPTPAMSAQYGWSKPLVAFRERGYWASLFPEGDGITLRWWDDDAKEFSNKTAEQVMRDISECFGWEVVDGAGRRKGGKQ